MDDKSIQDIVEILLVAGKCNGNWLNDKFYDRFSKLVQIKNLCKEKNNVSVQLFYLPLMIIDSMNLSLTKMLDWLLFEVWENALMSDKWTCFGMSPIMPWGKTSQPRDITHGAWSQWSGQLNNR